jgi:ABC-type branched-subunit amino acid transport system ATPase component
VRVAVSDLRAGYGSATIVDGIDLAVADGEAVAVVGRNGMGKSTFVKAILGLIARKGGSVAIGGRDVAGWATHRIVRLGVGYAPQEENLFGDLSVADNLDVGWARGRVTEARRGEILDHFPVLAQRLRQFAGTLSGGEQKMLVLARALLMGPDLLVLDEISDGLQPAVVAQVQQLLAAERERAGLTVVMVEQNLDLSLAVADRVAVMKLGRLVFEAASDQEGVHDELTAQLAP